MNPPGALPHLSAPSARSDFELPCDDGTYANTVSAAGAETRPGRRVTDRSASASEFLWLFVTTATGFILGSALELALVDGDVSSGSLPFNSLVTASAVFVQYERSTPIPRGNAS